MYCMQLLVTGGQCTTCNVGFFPGTLETAEGDTKDTNECKPKLDLNCDTVD